jgi:hypothetical protein
MHLWKISEPQATSSGRMRLKRVQKPNFVFRRNGRIHLNRRGRQFSRLLAAELCASAVIELDTQSSDVVWRVLATHSIRQFPLHFPRPVRHRVPSHFKWSLRTGIPLNMLRCETVPHTLVLRCSLVAISTTSLQFLRIKRYVRNRQAKGNSPKETK